MVNTILREADLFCPNSVGLILQSTIYVNLSSKVVETAIPHGNILLNTYEDYTNNTLFPYQGILIEVDKNE